MTSSEKFAKRVGYVFMFSALIVVASPFATAAGALAGWTTGLVFGSTILPILAKLGLHDVAMWQLGATVGFFGGFLRTSTEVKEKL